MTARAARMTWGATALISEGIPPSDRTPPYVIEASADGTNWGNPEAIVTQVQSRLQDGSLASVDSYGNRQAPIYLRVTSDTYDGLAAAEAVLVAETQRPGYNTLAWTPDEDNAAVSVFDVVYAVLTIDQDSGWDLDELRKARQYVATLTCLPFPRSDTLVVAEAILPPPDEPTDIDVDDCESSDGWFWAPGDVVETGTSLRVLWDSGQQTTLQLGRTAAIDMTDTPYLWLDWRWGAGAYERSLTTPLTLTTATSTYTPVASTTSPIAGCTRSYFSVPSIPSGFGVRTIADPAHDPWPPADPTFFEVAHVGRTDTLPGSDTRRELIRSLPVAGSVRTQGRLAIEHDTDGLGEALIYVYSDGGVGYRPPLRQFYASGGSVTLDASTVSGAYNMLDMQVGFEVPARTLPAGSYRLYAMLKGSSAGTVTMFVQAGTILDGTPLPGSQGEAVTIDITTSWKVYDLTGFALPSNAGPASLSGDTVELINIVDASASGIDIYLDEAWLFSEDVGGLTHVECGTGTGAAGGPSNRLWLDPATLTNDGQPAVYIGHAADRSDAYNPGDKVKGWTPPEFEPATVTVLVVTPGAENASSVLSHFPRGLHNVRAVS